MVYDKVLLTATRILHCFLPPLADRAKAIKTTATINESPSEKLIRELREENKKMMAMLKKAGLAGSLRAAAEEGGEKEGAEGGSTEEGSGGGGSGDAEGGKAEGSSTEEGGGGGDGGGGGAEGSSAEGGGAEEGCSSGDGVSNEGMFLLIFILHYHAYANIVKNYIFS